MSRGAPHHLRQIHQQQQNAAQKQQEQQNHVKYLRAGPAEMPFQNWYSPFRER